MKKSFLILMILIFASSAYSHVFPLNVASEYKLPKNEYWYIRILPSPVLEGFASYELCPFIQDHNKDLYLINTEKQKLGMGDYHHDLIHPKCQRPYQRNPLLPPIYFDMRDLDRVLSVDEQLETIKTTGVVGVSIAAMWASGGLLTPALAGWVASAGIGYVAGEATDYALNQMIPIEQDMLQLTRIEYFTGVQGGEGQDLHWPILPIEIQTVGECLNACRVEQKQYRLQAEEAEQSREKSKSIRYSEKVIFEPTESISNQNPLRNIDICAHQCNGLPSHRPSIKKLWEDLFLKTIYEAGNQHYLRKGPVDQSMRGADQKKQFEAYHERKHMDWSAWALAKDVGGNQIANHYTHRSNLDHPSYDYTKRYQLCDRTRQNSYESYKKSGGTLKLNHWMEKKCSYPDSQKCREFFDSEVQSGNQICTIMIED